MDCLNISTGVQRTHLDHPAFVNSRRDERSLGHYTRGAYAQDLRTLPRFTKAHQLIDPLSKDAILARHLHLRDELEAKPATIERRFGTLKSFFACRADQNSSPAPHLRASVLR